MLKCFVLYVFILLYIICEGTFEILDMTLISVLHIFSKVNAGTKGVYRVQYTSEMLNRFIPSIQDRSLPPTDRLGLISDLFALVSFFLLLFILI